MIGKEIPNKFTFHKLKLSPQNYEKGDYPHFMLKEIYEQPDIIQNILDKRLRNNGNISFNEMQLSPEYLGQG